MTRLKIDFGIDLGTTNSAIAVYDNGKTKIFKNDVLGETMPSCVWDRGKSFFVGHKAYAQLPKDKIKAFKDPNFKTNIFIEFKRTIGNSIKYFSDNNKELSSEELSSEVLKTLRSYVKEEVVKSAIITIPAAFEMNQINATKKAAELAGLEYVELVQEPYAAAIAYGVESSNKNGYWLVFDFGGGTFDSALVKVEDGIIKVIDTEGDNFLGGKNLDEAIVEQVFIPYLNNKFSIDSISNDDFQLNAFKEMWKPLAEDAKNQLSFKEEYNILAELYDEYGEDDNGEAFTIDITLTRNELKGIIAPFIQKAIDYCQVLLKRNNLSGSSLNELILVGGPTLSPIVREMLENQIKKPNTSIDPMTVVAQGAAIYASSINNPVEGEIDNSKVQLQIDYESMVVGVETFITIKTKETGKVVFAEISRGDAAFKSDKVELNNIGEVIELALIENDNNIFTIQLFNEKGDKLECEPNNFSIKEGTVAGGAPLPHSICIEVIDKLTKKKILKPLIGLEKNKTLPAVGVFNDLKSKKQIRPGMDDYIDIPIYQGEPYTKAILNNHVSTIRITGNDLPGLLVENSLANLTIEIDRSNIMSGKVNFIDLDFEMPFEVNTNESSLTEEWLKERISETEEILFDLNLENKEDLENDLERVKEIFNNKKTEAGRLEARSELQKVAKVIDDFENSNEWPKLEAELKEEFYSLEKANNDHGSERTTQMVNSIKVQLEQIIQQQDVRLGNAILEEMRSLYVGITLVYQLIGFIRSYNQNFDSYQWKDRSQARSLLNQGLLKIGESPNVDELHPIVRSLIDLLPPEDRANKDIFEH
jgi:molecular chaperone DnaK